MCTKLRKLSTPALAAALCLSVQQHASAQEAAESIELPEVVITTESPVAKPTKKKPKTSARASTRSTGKVRSPGGAKKRTAKKKKPIKKERDVTALITQGADVSKVVGRPLSADRGKRVFVAIIGSCVYCHTDESVGGGSSHIGQRHSVRVVLPP